MFQKFVVLLSLGIWATTISIAYSNISTHSASTFHDQQTLAVQNMDNAESAQGTFSSFKSLLERQKTELQPMRSLGISADSSWETNRDLDHDAALQKAQQVQIQKRLDYYDKQFQTQKK